MFKTTKMQQERNYIKLSGTLVNIFTIENEEENIISLDIHSYRKQINNQNRQKFDEIRVYIFNQPDFLNEFAPGDRIQVIGEIQSRNYEFDYVFDDEVQIAVDNYFHLFQTIPTLEIPAEGKRVDIDWRKLTDISLIENVPNDSKKDEWGNRRTDKDARYIYTVDETGKVSKVTQHTAYEVAAKKYKKLEEPLEPAKGDYNYVNLVGKVIRKVPVYTNSQGIMSCTFNLATVSSIFENRFYYLHVLQWESLARAVQNELEIGEVVEVSGRFQSRPLKKDRKNQWLSKTGKKRVRQFESEVTIREISASTILICKATEDSNVQ